MGARAYSASVIDPPRSNDSSHTHATRAAECLKRGDTLGGNRPGQMVRSNTVSRSLYLRRKAVTPTSLAVASVSLLTALHQHRSSSQENSLPPI